MPKDIRRTGTCVCFFSGQRISLYVRSTGNLRFVRTWKQRVLSVVWNTNSISRSGRCWDRWCKRWQPGRSVAGFAWVSYLVPKQDLMVSDGW